VPKEENGVMKEQHALIALYADDLLIACFNKKRCRDLEKKFSAEFSIKIMGSVNHILGMDVRNSVEKHTVGTREWLASRNGDDELLITGKSQITKLSRNPEVTSSEDLSSANMSAQPNSTHTMMRKQRYETYIADSETAAMLSQVLTVLAALIDSGDSFTQLATEEIYKRQSLVPTPEHLAQADYEPSHCKYMLRCDKHESWQQGEREELQFIEKNCVWTRKQPPYGTKVIPLKWVDKVMKDRLGAIQRYKRRLVAQGFFEVFGQDYTDTYSSVAKLTSI
jgi:Reverse transcriptase (RNA-dependent DNA polymerase)